MPNILLINISYLLIPNNMSHKSWFTLVEMVVGITISMLLMVWVTSLVWWWMQNIIWQQKVLKDQSFTVDSFYYFQESFSGLDVNYSPKSTWSWFLFKRKKDFDHIGFAYLWTKTISEFYCPVDSETPDTQHIYLQNILPFEEIWEDIFQTPSDIHTSKNVNNLYIDTLNHSVKNSIDDSIIIWKWYFWNQWKNGDDLNSFYLNTPTGIAFWNWVTYISDTGNNRILSYSGGKVEILLDSTDGLSEPTWLDYDNNTLYISNSWKWEILAYSSKILPTAPNANITFTADSDINNFTNIEFIFKNISTLSRSNNISNYDFPSWWKSVDFLSRSSNILRYYFTDFSLESTNYEPSQCNSTNNRITIESGSPKKYEYVSCSASWTWTLNIYSWDNSHNITAWNSYDIWIENIPNDFSAAGNYYIQAKFYNRDTEVGNIFVPYFTQWNNILSEKKYSSLKVIKNWLQYPTWIEVTWNNIKFNDFLERTEKVYNMQTKSLSTTKSLSWFSHTNFEKIPLNNHSDFILNLPIKSLDLQIIDNLFHGSIKYYRIYNCYNPEENSIRTFLIKKFLQ